MTTIDKISTFFPINFDDVKKFFLSDNERLNENKKIRTLQI